MSLRQAHVISRQMKKFVEARDGLLKEAEEWIYRFLETHLFPIASGMKYDASYRGSGEYDGYSIGQRWIVRKFGRSVEIKIVINPDAVKPAVILTGYKGVSTALEEVLDLHDPEKSFKDFLMKYEKKF